MDIRASAEDYLETILLLSKKTGSVRPKDIMDETGYTKQSVSIAVKKLREGGLATVREDGGIQLTEAGRAAASQVYERHSVLFEWLVSLGVSEKNAAADACRMEHILSEESFAAIKNRK